MPVAKCLIGIGSPFGDDQAGWLIADAVTLRKDRDFGVSKVSSPLEILDRIDGIKWLGICDACRGLGEAGQTRRWKWPDQEISTQKFTGSHDFGLAAVLELAKKLGRLPETVMVWGIEIGTVESQTDVSHSIQRAIPALTDEITQELSSFR